MRPIRLVGFLVGFALAVGVVLLGRVPEGQARSGASVTVATSATTQLGVTPAGDLLSARGLRPGERGARASVALANFTARELTVRARARPTATDLDRILLVEIAAGGKRLFRGTLGELRSPTARAVTLAPREARRAEVRTWIPAPVREGFEGRSAAIELEWRTGR